MQLQWEYAYVTDDVWPASKVNGKTGILTRCRSETPEKFITKIGLIDYVTGGNTHAKFYGNRPKGVRCPPHK